MVGRERSGRHAGNDAAHHRRRLADKLWPGPLTMVLPPSDELPSKVRKVLTRATGRLGVQVPADPLASALMRQFGGPLLLASANLEQKPGANSAAARGNLRIIEARDLTSAWNDLEIYRAPRGSPPVVKTLETHVRDQGRRRGRP